MAGFEVTIEEDVLHRHSRISNLSGTVTALRSIVNSYPLPSLSVM